MAKEHEHEHEDSKNDDPKSRMPGGGSGGSGDAIYAIGIVGAATYFWQRADSNAGKGLAVLKGFVWPALLVYQVFSLLEDRSAAPPLPD